ncbi:MAG: ABC transporter ATP-binding protein [Bacteroidota bacterium]|nr:ABC transporter ATP-binding protein [Bacteroidota bacterium]
MRLFLRILKYINPYFFYVAVNIIFNFFSIIFSLVSLTMVIPFLGILFETQQKVYNPPPITNLDSLKETFYAVITTLIDEKGQLEALFFICMLVLVTFFARNLFRYLALYYLIPIRNGIVHDIRKDMHKKIMSLRLGFFTEKRKGDITARMTTDLVEIEWSIMSSLEIIFKDPLNIILYLITLIILSPKLTLFVIILFPIAGFLIGFIGKSLKKSSDRGQKKMGELLSAIDENIIGLRIIKSLNAEYHINEKFTRKSASYKEIMSSLLRKKDLSSPMSEFLSTIVMVIIMWIGGDLVLSGKSNLTAQEFIGYILIFSQLIPPAKSFTSSYYYIQKGSAAAKRIYEILDFQNIIQEDVNAVKKTTFEKNILFKNISFKYDSQSILNNITLEIPKGHTIALVGESGSGKSTLADLLPRFYDIETGGIFIDDINIKDIKIKNLRNLMGIVSQESILFHDTIMNNIKLGNLNSTKQEIITAAKIANAHDFIMKMDNQYQTNIGDRGNKLSGGEKQRISIARAILKDPNILILDEATSSLDTKSEKLVQQALTELMKNRTSIVIAHRLSTIQHANEIIVLHEGKIVEKGTHQSLMYEQNGYYKKLYDLQVFS